METQTHAPGSPGLRARYRTPRLIVEKENFFGPHLVSLTDTPVSLPTSTYLGVPTIFGYPYYVLCTTLILGALDTDLEQSDNMAAWYDIPKRKYITHVTKCVKITTSGEPPKLLIRPQTDRLLDLFSPIRASTSSTPLPWMATAGRMRMCYRWLVPPILTKIAGTAH